MKKKTLENKIKKDKFSLVEILQGHNYDLSHFYGEYKIIKSNLTKPEAEELRKTYVVKNKEEFEIVRYYRDRPRDLIAKYHYWIEKEPIDHQWLSMRATPSLM